MAKLTVKLITGEAFELEDVELDQVTNQDVIHQLTDAGCMVLETELPSSPGGVPMRYSIIDKYCNKIPYNETKTLAEFGFCDGDTVRVICGFGY